MLRLPLAVAPIFRDWLARAAPSHAERVESRVRSVHGGKLNVSAFGERMRGTGPLAEQIDRTFRVFARRYRLDGALPAFDFTQFQPPAARSGQLRLF